MAPPAHPDHVSSQRGPGPIDSVTAYAQMIVEEFGDVAILHAQIGRDRMRSYQPQRDCCVQCHTGVNFGILGLFDGLVEYVTGQFADMPAVLTPARRNPSRLDADLPTTG